MSGAETTKPVDASAVHDQWRVVALAAHDVQVASGHAVRMSVLDDEDTPADTAAWLADLAAKVERLRVEHALLCARREDAGISVPGLLVAVALAFVLAAGLPTHAAVPLIVAALVGYLSGLLFWAEVSTWGTPANARHRDGAL